LLFIIFIYEYCYSAAIKSGDVQSELVQINEPKDNAHQEHSSVPEHPACTGVE